MKFSIKKTVLTLLMAFVCVFAFASVQDIPSVDLTNPDVIVGILTAVVTLVATWTAKKFMPFLTGTVTLVAVPILAGLIGLLTNYIMENDLSFLMKVLTGTGSVYLHQLYLNITGKANK